MRYFLGIDGGGSGTLAWLTDDAGRILARARAGPSNPVKVGLPLARKRLLMPALQVRRRARLESSSLDAVCAGVAGVDQSNIHRHLLAALRRAVPARRYLLTTDGLIALQIGLRGMPGVMVNSGTGSIAYALDAGRHVLRAGGWGSLLGDEGSGYDVSRKALAGALRDFDGRGPHTRLTRELTSALNLAKISDAVGANLQPHQIAALFPVVDRAARSGDAFACALLKEAGRSLAALAWCLVEKLGVTRTRVRVVCAGGVFRESAAVRRSFARSLCRRAPDVAITLLTREPVEGALALARALADGRKLMLDN